MSFYDLPLEVIRRFHNVQLTMLRRKLAVGKRKQEHGPRICHIRLRNVLIWQLSARGRCPSPRAVWHVRHPHRPRLCRPRRAAMRLKHASLCLFVCLLVPLVLSSSGDRAESFRSCVSICQSRVCGDSTSEPLPLALRLTRWTCVDDCKYQCMHMITDRAIEHGSPVEQYYGKWPFWRYAGMQEPASVLFSTFNFAAHALGARKIRARVSRDHPMRRYYLMFAFVSMNAWVWSSVFHTRGRPMLLLSAV